ncbi:hypothetical protein [Streptomyces aureus]|uniref:hypothetical protein n=1 Tax=Streptomyces aureus TaxID=193461 RepID=UPI00362C3348
MAEPLTPDKFLSILRSEGVKTSEYAGWRGRERDAATGKTFGPVHMVLNHHTAGKNSRDTVAKHGVPGLPAPSPTSTSPSRASRRCAARAARTMPV